MNPFSAITWFWQALRARSITFSVLFAAALFGFSVLGWFRHALKWLGIPWYGWLILPVVLVSILARKEAEWMPDGMERRKWSRWIVAGAIVLVILAAKLAPDRNEADLRPERRDGQIQSR